jgi:hypothetical protein
MDIIFNFYECCKKHHRKRLHFNFGVEHPVNKENKMPLNITINTNEKENVILSPVDSDQQAATLVGVPVWTVKSGDVTIAPAADGLSCFILSGTVGDSVVQVDAEGDPNPGVDHLTDTVNVTVTNAEATNLGLTGTPPVLK